uniref:Reverse transcriptase domain-containing protein n=1 Tax=Fagus sylvatica TaxID=28930 RepID=A0A2N9F204_FAGSY
MESLEGLWEKFSLSENEGNLVDLISTADQPKSCLATKFLTRRALNAEAVARTFKPLWRTDHGFTIRDMNDNILVFAFEDEADRERVMLGEPWAYDKHLVVLQRIKEDEAIAEVEFKNTSFWVQMHGIPIRRMNHDVATILGQSLGKIVHVSRDGESAEAGQAMRIRKIPKRQHSLNPPTIYPPPISTIFPPPSSTTSPPPPISIPAQTQSPTQEDHAVHMEMEENLICTPLPSQPGRQEDHFESQLRDIDATLNYHPPTAESIMKLLEKENVSTSQGTRTVFGDITNATQPKVREPKVQSAKKSWKKLARTPALILINSQRNTVELLMISYRRRLWDSPAESHELPSVELSWAWEPTNSQELARLVCAQDPTVVFLIETWQDEGPLERLRCKLHFDNKFVANSQNKGGGLCLLWKSSTNIKVNSFSPSHIDAVVDDNTPNAWRFTGFYGAPETSKREESWALLRRLNSQSTLPWCCMGDFNELVRLEEKQGRHNRSERQMQLFRDVLDDCGFVDLGFNGPKFTWTNNRMGDMTWERLDRAVATPEWLLCFPSAQVLSPGYQGCEETVANAWKKSVNGVPMFSVWEKIHTCRRELRSWSKHNFGNIKTKIKEVEHRLKQAEEASMQGHQHHQVWYLRRELHSLLAKEERLWRQRSRAEWLKAGDRNTRYFHCRATQRQRRNYVYQLKNSEGRWTTNHAQIDQVAEHIMPVVTEEMNADLNRAFSPGEVVAALKQMAPLKAPGPDGLPPLFFQKYWHLIGDEVTEAVLTCLNTGKILKAINHTYITLIPKIQNPEVVVDFRPISLCNVIYKIISKVLANRLKILLPKIVSESQSAFVPGRLITDNILVAFETLHHMQHQKKGRIDSMALKLDMSALKGVSISRGGPKITHLFFADDSLLFCKATTADVERIQGILSQYERASGQQINRQKTTIFFSKSTPQSAQAAVQNMLGVPAIKQYERYLGLPSFIGRAKYSSFAQIKERVWSKLKGWKEKLISQAGREILIKSVAQAIPAYAMSCFRLPNRLIQEIEVLIRRFWWGQSGDKGKMHWLSWNTLCKSKASGGIGFRELGCFNEALLAKQVWRLMHNPSSLFYKVFKAKYFPRCSILEANPVSTSSYAWKGIMSARDLIKKGSTWRVGNGSDIRIWGDRWLPSPYNQLISSPPIPPSSLSQVAHLIDHQSRTWKEGLIRETFLPHDATTIMGIPLSSHPQSDCLVWGGTRNGRYAVRSGYHLLIHERAQADPGPSDTTAMTNLWHSIWSLQVPPKTRHFLWRACHESLPTRRNLHHRHIIDDPTCENCSNQVETTLHALWNCKTIQVVWQTLPWGRRLQGATYADFMDLWHRCTQLLSTTELQLFSMVTWLIWYHRNRVRLHQPTNQITRIVPRAQELITEFTNEQDRPPVSLIVSKASAVIKWQPPAEGRYKVNYDGAIFRDMNEAGLGVIIRNARGAVMGPMCQRVPFPHSIEAVEARCAIQFAKDLGLQEIDLEGDSKIVVDALLFSGPCTTFYGHIIEDIKLIARGLSSVHFQHVKRDGNNLAHLLAKRARLNESLEVWLESVPPELVSKLVLDSSFQ